ncbi:Hypothetical protein R9X50_00257500 [Acrodontium crateriforme]|uniref:Matrin-type domain-containing protein n=1 Tax=Acrodontium crateriforme TaxID=150365 RepID=A0AAQ3M160_9PEZI|nr:Hypothetical protein R9X50_00257500 [Acrodontium crateriforme]
MSEYWKSTPNYWCKFCAIYVKDTSLERKNHEASGKHQNNIQRSLRDLHKNKEREEREKQRAKDEVARLNGLVGGSGQQQQGKPEALTGRAQQPAITSAPKLTTAEQRRAHAEQLAALGVELPEELKREITGVGGWQTVSERIIEAPRSLADIKREEDAGTDVQHGNGTISQGVHKRRMQDEEEDARDEEAAPKPRAWGSKMKTYPGSKDERPDEDLDALLSGVTKKPKTEAKSEPEPNELGSTSGVKDEPSVKGGDTEARKTLDNIPDVNAPSDVVKPKDEDDPAPAVIFKKRKIKK